MLKSSLNNLKHSLAALCCVCALACNLFAEDGDGSIGIAMGPVTATKPVLEKASQDSKNRNTLQTIVRGLESDISAHFSNNESPFAIIGGNVGANLFKKIVVDEKLPVEDGEQENVKYGMSIEVTNFMDSTLKSEAAGFNTWSRKLSVSANIHLHDIGKMRAVIAVPSLNAVSEKRFNVRKAGDAKQLESYTDDMIRDVQQQIVKQLANELLKAYYKFPGYVVKTDGVMVTIDQGVKWCKVGEKLIVYGPPEEREKATRGRLKVTKSIKVHGPRKGIMTVTEVFPDTAVCTAAGITGIVEGCIVEKSSANNPVATSSVSTPSQEQAAPLAPGESASASSTAGTSSDTTAPEKKKKPVLVVKCHVGSALASSVRADLQGNILDQTLTTLRQVLETQIGSTGKFIVRADSETMTKQFNDAFASSEVKVADADYTLLITITEFSAKLGAGKEISGGREVAPVSASLAGQIKIFNAGTGEILPGTTADIPVSRTEQVVIGTGWTFNPANFLPALARDFSAAAVAKLTENLSPAEVIDVEGSTITINVGEGFFTKGETIRLYGPAKVKRGLRIPGAYLGTAQITLVDREFSQAQLTTNFLVNEGSQVRR
ncbi:MAG: hypothetical protein LBT53_08665 [Puniceicoccales bacterium]|jgi:hypothetical protein|nr:hypothetical protein [Puniceicoccales bacterium]